jgi:hypothetical protein
MVEGPHQVWMVFRDCSADVDALFVRATSPTFDDISVMVERLYRESHQLVASAVGAAGLVVLYTVAFERSTIPSLIGRALVAALAGFLVGQCVYLIIVTGLFCRTMSRASDLELDWHAPLLTPGLQGCSHAVRLMGQLGSLLLLLVTGALVAQFVDVPSAGSFSVAAISIVTGLALLVLIAVTSQYWLAKPGLALKDRTLRNLGQEIEALADWGRSTPDLSADRLRRLAHLMAIHDRVARSPDSYNDRNTFTAYLATALGIVIQLLAALALA